MSIWKNSVKEMVNPTSEKAESLQTILAIANTMMGSVCLVLPTNVYNSGVVMSVMLQTLMCYVCYKTVSYLVMYQKREEDDVSKMVERILGPKYKTLLCMFSAMLLFICTGIYFILQCKCLYHVLVFLLEQAGSMNHASSTTDIVFNQFSIQYCALILIIPMFWLLSLKDLTMLISLAQYGVAALVAYGLFIFYICYDNVSSGQFQAHQAELPLFSSNIIGVLGSYSMAFSIHSCLTSILSKNAIWENNLRDTKIAYGLVYLIYGIIGVFGCIGITGRLSNNPKTIFDYFGAQEVLPNLVGFLFFLQLTTVLPILGFIGRSQFLSLFYKPNEIPPKVFLTYNIAQATLCLSFVIFQISPTLVIGIDGAICGFFIIYFIPFQMWRTQPLHVEETSERVSVEMSYITKSLAEPFMSPSTQEDNEAILDREEDMYGHLQFKEWSILPKSELYLWAGIITLASAIGISQFLQIFV